MHIFRSFTAEFDNCIWEFWEICIAGRSPCPDRSLPDFRAVPSSSYLNVALITPEQQSFSCRGPTYLKTWMRFVVNNCSTLNAHNRSQVEIFFFRCSTSQILYVNCKFQTRMGLLSQFIHTAWTAGCLKTFYALHFQMRYREKMQIGSLQTRKADKAFQWPIWLGWLPFMFCTQATWMLTKSLCSGQG